MDEDALYSLLEPHTITSAIYNDTDFSHGYIYEETDLIVRTTLWYEKPVRDWR